MHPPRHPPACPDILIPSFAVISTLSNPPHPPITPSFPQLADLQEGERGGAARAHQGGGVRAGEGLAWLFKKPFRKLRYRAYLRWGKAINKLAVQFRAPPR